MPVIKRLVEPVYCSRAPIPKGVKNELETVAVNTLSDVILQLSSLAKHAESIFAELFDDANNIYQRTCNVQQRLVQLRKKVTQLDSAGEEISLQDINMQKAFKLIVRSDQQVVSRQTLPEAMLESYSKCDPVPNLKALTIFRHDGKDALKFYTDPDYFFELWKQKMSVELESRRRKKKKENRAKRQDTEKKDVKGVKKKDVSRNVPEWEIQAGKQIHNQDTSVASDTSEKSIDIKSPTPSVVSNAFPQLNDSPNLSPRRQSTKRMSTASLIGRPTSAPPPPPPLGSISSTSVPDFQQPPPPPFSHQNSIQLKPNSPPPPPPPPVAIASSLDSSILPPPPYEFSKSAVGNPPMPPPPPYMSTAPLPPPPPASVGGISSSLLSNVKLSAAKPPPPVEVDPRNDLLGAIRKGMNLKKTQQISKEEKQLTMGNDVASILARRIALEVSDSEEDGDSDTDDNWSDGE